MGNFREWLSDHLRYLALGAGILAALLLLFAGVRACSGHSSDAQSADAAQTAGSGEDGEETAGDEETAETLEADPVPEVSQLIRSYYEALGDRDTETIRSLVDSLSAGDESAIVNSTVIAGYSDVVTYVKDGLEKGSYVVFACYGHSYTGYDTVLPGVSYLYVMTAEDGSLCIRTEPEEAEQACIQSALEDEEIQALLDGKQEEYDALLASDPDLAAYLETLGLAGSRAMDAEVGSVITAKSNCNVRASADENGEKLGELIAGQEVTKTGQDGDWIQIEYDGQVGYVRGDLFE